MYKILDRLINNAGEIVTVRDIFVNGKNEVVYKVEDEDGDVFPYFEYELKIPIVEPKIDVTLTDSQVQLEFDIAGKKVCTFGWLKTRDAYGYAQALNSAAYRMMSKLESTEGTISYEEFLERFHDESQI